MCAQFRHTKLWSLVLPAAVTASTTARASPTPSAHSPSVTPTVVPRMLAGQSSRLCGTPPLCCLEAFFSDTRCHRVCQRLPARRRHAAKLDVHETSEAHDVGEAEYGLRTLSGPTLPVGRRHFSSALSRACPPVHHSPRDSPRR